jgi:glycosyltransferase involved in cell wall biosynthesis
VTAAREGCAPERPSFSIFIPVWNDTRWLPGAIESVLAQDYPHWELIVGDNASTADVEEVVRRYADPRICYQRWETHVPVDESFNRTARLCRNEWVQPLSADDRLRPACLSRLAAEIEQAQARTHRLAVVMTACARVYPDGTSADQLWYGSKPRLPVRAGLYDSISLLDLFTHDGNPPWNTGSVAVHRTVLAESGGLFRPEIGLSCDVELVIRAGAYGDVSYVDDVLLDFTVRQDADNTAKLIRNRSGGSRNTTMAAALLAGLAVHEHRREVSRRERRAILAAVARSHLQRAGQHRIFAGGQGRHGAASDVIRAFRHSPPTVLAPHRFVYALATILGPRALLLRGQRLLAGRHG